MSFANLSSRIVHMLDVTCAVSNSLEKGAFADCPEKIVMMKQVMNSTVDEFLKIAGSVSQAYVTSQVEVANKRRAAIAAIYREDAAQRKAAAKAKQAARDAKRHHFFDQLTDRHYLNSLKHRAARFAQAKAA